MGPNIDSVRVNGDRYGISTSGGMPIRAYFGTGACGQPYFDSYVPQPDEEFTSALYTNFFVRRTGECGHYEYDLVILYDDANNEFTPYET